MTGCYSAVSHRGYHGCMIYLAILIIVSPVIAEGDNILDFCAYGHVNATNITVIKEKEDTSLAAKCTCEVQGVGLIQARVSFDLPKTVFNCDEDITIEYTKRCSKTRHSYDGTLSLGFHTYPIDLTYERRRHHTIKRSGYVKVFMKATSTSYMTVTCKGPKPGNHTVSTMETIRDGETSNGTEKMTINGPDKNIVLIIALLLSVL